MKSAQLDYPSKNKPDRDTLIDVGKQALGACDLDGGLNVTENISLNSMFRRGYIMPFINDYLTEEEKEMFKKRAIPYRMDITWKPGTVGYRHERIKSTLDRERQIYLFDCGRHHDSDEPNDYHFVIVWGDDVVFFDLKRKYLDESVPGKGPDIFWHSLSLGLPGKSELDKRILIDVIKDALNVFGLAGNPKHNWKFIVKFDF